MTIRSTRFRISAAVLLAATCMVFAAGCARIADPQPPEVLIPKAAVDLAAHQNANSIVLTVTLPEQNTDGSPATTLQSVEVFRIAEKTKPAQVAPLKDEQFIAQSARIQSIPASRFSTYLQDKTMVIQDVPQLLSGLSLSSQGFRYAVLFVNNRGQAAGLSNQTYIMPIPTPPPPEGLAGETTESAIILKWTPPAANMDGSKPARIAGYNVYRSEQAGIFPASPVNPNPVAQPAYQDSGFEFDKTYFYAVTTIGSLQNPFAESLRSKAVEVKARDIFPPASPKDFNAIFENGKVILLWTPSSSSDVAGYRLYRESAGGAARQLLEEQLITRLSYRDSRIELNKEYEYSIQTVDTHGNESDAVRTSVSTR